MEKNKIPSFNNKFDIRVLFKILKASIGIVFLLMVLAIATGIVYHRYTAPVFEAFSIIQIKEENKTKEFLNIKTISTESDLTSVIELIKSNTFIQECLVELPLEVSYFQKGTFLSTELYRQSPFTVYFNVSNQEIYDMKFYISFIKDKFTLNYTIGKQEFEYLLNPQEWNTIYGGEIFVHYENTRTIKADQEAKNGNKYFFVINNPASLNKKILQNLEVRVQNERAGTIKISYSDNNARKAAEIANTVAEKFIIFDLNRKKESANNVVKYIDQQLESIYAELDQTEQELFNFRKENRIPPGESGFGGISNIYSTKINDIENKIIDIELEIIALEKVKKDIDTNPKLNIYELMALISGTNTQSFVTNMLSSLQSLLDQKQVLLFDVTANNHKIRTLDEQIEEKKASIADFIGSAIIRLEAQKKQYQASISEFESDIFRDTSFKEAEFTKLNRLYGINESFYYQLIKTKAEY
ncbi:MAG: hypothetical protein GX879_04805, partial [Bacteroidales bacterium]|nr:hypothetical protein [Bacteroidales bacterium]